MNNMDVKCRRCFFISWKDEYMRNLFQLWNKAFTNKESLKNHQRKNAKYGKIYINRFVNNIINPVANSVRTNILENLHEFIGPDFIGNATTLERSETR